MSLRVDLSKEDALAALRAAAWPEHQEKVYEPAIYGDGKPVLLDGEQLYRDITPPERKVIHTQGGGFGSDWDLEGAEEFIRGATEVFWGFALFGHHLHATSAAGQHIAFDVQAPDEVRAEWQRQAVQS